MSSEIKNIGTGTDKNTKTNLLKKSDFMYYVKNLTFGEYNYITENIEYYKNEVTDEERVIYLLKGDFEKRCLISFETFKEIYENLLKTEPDKLRVENMMLDTTSFTNVCCEEIDEKQIHIDENAENYILWCDVVKQLRAQYHILKHNNDIYDENDKEKVIRLVVSDFEKFCGISLDIFFKIYNDILTNNPEKLI